MVAFIVVPSERFSSPIHFIELGKATPLRTTQCMNSTRKSFMNDGIWHWYCQV